MKSAVSNNFSAKFPITERSKGYQKTCTQVYRYRFNGQEQDNEIAGTGNIMTAEFWEYDTRLGRRWNVDPVVKHPESPYSTFSNNPIWLIDPFGDDTIKLFIMQAKWPNVYKTHVAGMKKNPQNNVNGRYILNYDSDKNANENRRRQAKRASGLSGAKDEDVDEFPYACTVQGGVNAACRVVPRKENRQHGAYLSWVIRVDNVKNGDVFDVVLVPDKDPEKKPQTVPEFQPALRALPAGRLFYEVERSLDKLNRIKLKMPENMPVFLPIPGPTAPLVPLIP